MKDSPIDTKTVDEGNQPVEKAPPVVDVSFSLSTKKETFSIFYFQNLPAVDITEEKEIIEDNPSTVDVSALYSIVRKSSIFSISCF